MRHIVFIVLTILGLAVSLSLVTFGLDASGVLGFLKLDPQSVVLLGVAIGIVGALTSWFLSSSVATWSVGARPLEDSDFAGSAAEVQSILERLNRAAALRALPRVLVYESDEINAFAAGWRPSRSIVILTSGLLKSLALPEIEAILAQQLVKIAAGDTSVFLLLAGTVHTFTIFPARMLSFLLGTSLRTFAEETPSDGTEKGLVAGFEVLLTGFASLVIRAFARDSEARADRAAAKIVGVDALALGLSRYEAASVTPSHREQFIVPLKFGATQAARTRLIGYHAPAPARRRALGA